MQYLFVLFTMMAYLALYLAPEIARAAIYECQVNGNYPLYSPSGRDLNLRAQGQTTCFGLPREDKMVINGQEVVLKTVMIETKPGEYAWVPAEGVTIGQPWENQFGRTPLNVTLTTPTVNTTPTPAATRGISPPLAVVAQPTPAPPEDVVAVIPTTLVPTLESVESTTLSSISSPHLTAPFSPISDVALPGTEESLNIFNIESGYRLRSSPKITSGNIVGGTLGPNDGLKLVFENGQLISENGFVKAKTSRGRQVWLHESALSVTGLNGEHLPYKPTVQTASLSDHNEIFDSPGLAQSVAEVRAPTLPASSTTTEIASETEMQQAYASLTAQLTGQTTATGPSGLEVSQAVGLSNDLQAAQEIYESLANQNPFPTPRPANLESLRQQFAAQKTTEAFSQVPTRNWGRVKVRSLNMRNSPGTSGTSVVATISEGGRVVVIDSKEVGGRRWHKVIPFDCASISPVNADPNMVNDDACNTAYWVAGSNIEGVTAPSATEIAARPNPDEFSEAGFCVNCEGIAAIGNSISDMGEAIEAAANEKANLFEEYMAFQKGFLQRHPLTNGTAAWAERNKAIFINELIEHMGLEKANDVILVLTAWGEARGSSLDRNGGPQWANMAEMATVMTIIDNRAKTGYYDQTPFVRDQSPASAQMRVALADRQFSVWNRRDVNLGKMMITGTVYEAEAGGLASMKRAFDTLRYMESGEIQPMGRLASRATRHYHSSSNGVAGTINWVVGNRKIPSPEMLTPGGVVRISSHTLYEGIR